MPSKRPGLWWLRRAPLACAVAFCCLLAAPAADAHRGVRAKKQKGTFFVAEASGGALFGSGFAEGGAGYALRSTFGVGGAFRGFPLRFYGVGVVRYGALSSTIEQGLQTAQLDRDMLDVSGGLRILIPVRRFRFLLEATFGHSWVDSSSTINGGLETYSASDDRFTTYLATGAQYRLHRHVSLGMLVEWSLPSQRAGYDVVGAISGVADDGGMQGWTALTGTIVGHF